MGVKVSWLPIVLSTLLYIGLFVLGIGAIAVVRPMRRIGLPTRRRALTVAVAGVAMVTVGLQWPAPIVRASRASLIDEMLPGYQFAEHHETRVRASPPQIFNAIRRVTAGEIRFFRLLTWLRNPRLSRAGREDILNAPDEKPILDVALGSGFALLGERPNQELVMGTLLGAAVDWPAPPTSADFISFARPGYAKAVMNFLVIPDGDDWCRLETNTRVFATDARAYRAFRFYWRVIYPGSAIIRGEWLSAVKRRAEV